MIVSKNKVKSTAIKSILLFLCISINNMHSAEMDEQHQHQNKKPRAVVVDSTCCCFWPWSWSVKVGDVENPTPKRASVFDFMGASISNEICISIDKKKLEIFFTPAQRERLSNMRKEFYSKLPRDSFEVRRDEMQSEPGSPAHLKKCLQTLYKTNATEAY